MDAMQPYHEADAAMYAANARGGGVLVCDDGLTCSRLIEARESSWSYGCQP
ncbi:hypothetical protein GCM10027430_05900 [Lysobacter tyrosinilyticus]